MSQEDQDRLDADLERRLRRVSQDPEPMPPAGIYEYVESVAVSGGAGPGHGHEGRGPRLALFASIAAALILAVGATAYLRTHGDASSPDASAVDASASAGPTGSEGPEISGGDLASASPSESPSEAASPSASASEQATESAPVSAPPTTPAGPGHFTFTEFATAPFSGSPALGSAATSGSRTLLIATVGLTGSVPSGHLEAATSADLARWTRLPAGTFGAATRGVAAACGTGFVVLTDGANATAWSSPNGSTWTSHVFAAGLGDPENQPLAGGPQGVAAILADGSMWFSSDCQTWHLDTMPKVSGAKSTSISVGYFKNEFVAVGSLPGSGMTGAGASFTSLDGTTWASAITPTPYIQLWTARDAVFASEAGNVGGGFATSSDGRTWKALPNSQIYPCYMGFQSDGTHIFLWKEQALIQVSTNGSTWTDVALKGNLTAQGSMIAIPGGFIVLPNTGGYVVRYVG